MSEFVFSKIHGAGNDFIVTDKINNNIPCDPEFIRSICDRRRGIGADGLIVISISENHHKTIPCFRMKYYNCDGGTAEMCGNGLRCAAFYAGKYLVSGNRNILFDTDAGILKTSILEDQKVQIQIPLVSSPEKILIEGKEYFKVNTGVPHLVVIVEDVAKINIEEDGKYLRRHELFEPEGVNVNFISLAGNGSPVMIRTYERGVEGETSACGTGISACALALAGFRKYTPPLEFLTKDNDTITIDFCYNENIVQAYNDILLTGPVEEVFQGEYSD